MMRPTPSPIPSTVQTLEPCTFASSSTDTKLLVSEYDYPNRLDKAYSRLIFDITRCRKAAIPR